MSQCTMRWAPAIAMISSRALVPRTAQQAVKRGRGFWTWYSLCGRFNLVNTYNIVMQPAGKWTAEPNTTTAAPAAQIPMLSVVAPCHNEQSVLGEFKKRVEAVCRQLELSFEIVLIDDGS